MSFQKIGKITRHFDHVIDVSVILSVEKLKQKAEANVHVRGKDIFVETDSEDMYASMTVWSTNWTGRYSGTRKKILTPQPWFVERPES